MPVIWTGAIVISVGAEEEEKDSRACAGATFSKHVNRQTRGGDGMSTVCDDYVYVHIHIGGRND